MTLLTYPWVPSEVEGPQRKRHQRVFAAPDGIYLVRQRGRNALAAQRWLDGVVETVADAVEDADSLDVNGLFWRGERLHCSCTDGRIFRLEGGRWNPCSEPSSVFKAQPWDAQLAYDAARDRLIQWGGYSGKGRSYHGLFLFDFASATWRRSSSGSKAPRQSSVDHLLVYDPSSARALRFGHERIAVLDGDDWSIREAPAHFVAFVGDTNRAAIPEPRGQAIFVLSLVKRTIVRFDPSTFAAERVGAIDDANGRLGEALESLVVDRVRKRLHIHHRKLGHRVLDLRAILGEP